MRSFVRAIPIVCVVLFGAPTLADEGEVSTVEAMLSAIPTIRDNEPEKKEEERGAPEAGMYAAYTQACEEAVLAYFKPPKKIVKAAPKAQLQLFVAIDAEGFITGVSTGERSGYRGFDAAAVAALNKVTQLPAPPAGWNPAHDRVIVTFSAEK